MNFILDVGNVLVRFYPEPYLDGLFTDADTAARMNELIFKSREWVLWDSGEITMEKMIETFCLRDPMHREQIEKTMHNLPEMLTEITESSAFLPRIKQEGHGLYFLSNYPREMRDIIYKKYGFFKLFDGGLFSCDVHLTKPDGRIYQRFLEDHGLRAENCVFFDDMPINVEAARSLGIEAVVFTGVQDFLLYL